MGSIDPRFNGSIFHKNYPQIIASDRALAKIIGARMAWKSTSVAAGTLVGRVTSTGFYVPYDDAVTGGADTAVGVLLDDVDFEAASGASGIGSNAARVCVGGASLYYDKLTGLDANGLTDMKARKVTDITGTNLLVF